MTNPTERGMLGRLRAIIDNGGRLDQTTDRFQSTVDQYLREVFPVLTHPRVLGNLASAQVPYTHDFLIVPTLHELPTQSYQYDSMSGSGYHHEDNWSIVIRTEDVQSPQILLKHRKSFWWYPNLSKRRFERDEKRHFESIFPSSNHKSISVISNIDYHYSSNPYNQLNPKTNEKITVEAIKPLESVDFVQHPETFPTFKFFVQNLLNQVLDGYEKGLGQMGNHIVQNILQDTGYRVDPTQQYTPDQVRGIAEQVLTHNPRIQRIKQEGATKQDLQAMLIALMETTAKDTTRAHDKQALQQAYATLRQYAGDNPQAQEAVEAFITNSVNLKDPKRALDAIIQVAGGFVPGLQGVVALYGALRAWTRP